MHKRVSNLKGNPDNQTISHEQILMTVLHKLLLLLSYLHGMLEKRYNHAWRSNAFGQLHFKSRLKHHLNCKTIQECTSKNAFKKKQIRSLESESVV